MNITGPSNLTVEYGHIAEFKCVVSDPNLHLKIFANQKQIHPKDYLNLSDYFDDEREYNVSSGLITINNSTVLYTKFWFVVNQKNIEVVQDGVHCRYFVEVSNEICITDSAYIVSIQYPKENNCTNVTEITCPEPQTCPEMPLPSLSDGSLKNKSISTVLWIVTVLLIIIRLF